MTQDKYYKWVGEPDEQIVAEWLVKKRYLEEIELPADLQEAVNEAFKYLMSIYERDGFEKALELLIPHIAARDEEIKRLKERAINGPTGHGWDF